MDNTHHITEAKLLIAPACPHCATMMNLLGELLKEGKISSLLMINIAEQPEQAAINNVRSVPWLKLGEIEFTGAHSRAELEHAIDLAVSDNGQQKLLFEQLKNGRLDEVAELVGRDRDLLSELVDLLKAKDVPMTVRIGVSAVLEGYQDKPDKLQAILPGLLELSESSDETIRADACHFLSLAGGDAARRRLQECTNDESSMVREVAAEFFEPSQRS